MENGSISSKENLSKRDQENATKTKHRSFESKNSTIKDTSERNDRSTVKGKKSFSSETAKESNGISGMSESLSNGGNEKRNKSTQNLKKDAKVARTPAVDQSGKTRSSLPREVPSDGSKREINSPGRIGDVTTTDTCPSRSFCNIGKRERRRDELEKLEGNLRQRLDVLECSMPAVMVWNIRRMSQDAPASFCRMRRALEKQFKDAKAFSCRSTPSRHYDSRVRDAEAERKLALRKMEEARALWSEKLAKLEEKRQKLEEAKRIQEERKDAMERLDEEAKALRDEMEKQQDVQQDGSCRYGECGDMKCRWLAKVPSVTSIESGDLQCLEKIQQLAEEEMIMKRDIAELERREEAYMRTLQQADELWSQLESDAVSTTSALKEQLDTKTAANQQLAGRVCELEDALEKCRAKLAACRTQLEKFLSVEKIEATIGRDDDVAEVADKEVATRVRVVHRPIGRVNDVATVRDGEVSVRAEVADGEAVARPAAIDADAEAAFVGDDKEVSVKPDVIDLGVDRPADLVKIEDAVSAVRSEDLAYEQQKLKEVRQYLAQLSSLEELYKEGEPCPPDFVCDGVVASPTGMTDEELIALGLDPAAPIKELEKKVPNDEKRERQFREELMKKADRVVDEKKEKKANKILDIDGKVIERGEERIAETPVRENVTRPARREKVANDSSVTTPDDVKPEIKKIEQDVVIQRDTILSWIDTIDTIRTKTAKHPDCYAAKRDADSLAEQVGAYIGIKSKEIEEKAVTITTEGNTSRDAKDETKVIKTEEKLAEKDEIKFVPESATKLPTSDVVTEVQVEPSIVLETIKTTKVAAEEAENLIAKREIIDSTEVKTPKKPIAESELPTDLKEKIPADVEPLTTVSIEDSFQPSAIPLEKDLEDDTIQLIEPHAHRVEYERLEIENKIPVKETVQITEKPETPQVDEDIKQIEKPVADIPVEAAMEEEKADKVSEETDESKLVGDENEVEKLKETPQPDKIKTTKANDATPHAEITEAKEIAEAPPVMEVKETERADVKETKPIMDFKEAKEIVPQTVSPTAELIKIEKPEPSELPVTAEKPLIVDVAEKQIEREEDEKPKERIELPEEEKEQPPILDAIVTEKVEIEEPIVPSDMIEEKIEAEPLPREDIKVEESLPTADEVTEKPERIQPVTEPPPMIKDKEQEIEAMEQPVVEVKPKREEDEKLEEIPEELTSLIELPKREKVIEKIEMIQPVIESPPTIKEVEKFVLEVKPVREEDEKIKKIPQEVTPLTELTEKEKEEERAAEEEKILEVIPPTKLPVDVKKEEVPTIQEKPEFVEAEKIIPTAETEPMEEGMPALKIDLRVAPQQYFIIAKIQEKEVVQILPMMTPQCMTCCLQPRAETTGPIEITRSCSHGTSRDYAEVVHTEVEQTEIAQTEITQTKIAQTEIAQAEIAQIKIAQTEITQTEIAQAEIAQTKLAQTGITQTEIAQIKAARSEVAQLKVAQTEVAQTKLAQTGITQTEIAQTEIAQIKAARSEVAQLKVAQTEVAQSEVAQTELVQTEFVQISTQTVSTVEPAPIRINNEYVKASKLKAIVESSAEIVGGRPEITGRKMPEHKRLRDQSTVTTASTGSQTVETGRVSHERAARDERERARVPTSELLRALKIAARRARPDTEREIRTINYGGKSDEIARQQLCNCCLCGKTSPSSSSIRPASQIPQIDAKTATPPAVSESKRTLASPKIDPLISYDKLCPECKASLLSKMSEKKRNIEHVIKVISRKKRTIEKRDQSCLVKISKQKVDSVKQKSKDDLPVVLEATEESSAQLLSSSCVCFKVEKNGSIKKGNCYCAE